MKAKDLLGIFGYMCLFGFIFLIFFGTGNHSDNDIKPLDEQDIIPVSHEESDKILYDALEATGAQVIRDENDKEKVHVVVIPSTMHVSASTWVESGDWQSNGYDEADIPTQTVIISKE